MNSISASNGPFHLFEEDKVMANTGKKIFFGSALHCEGVRLPAQGTAGKTDCHQTFTSFLAWGYPAIRAWNTVFTLYGLDNDKSYTVDVVLSRSGYKRKKRLQRLIVNAGNRPTDLGSIIIANPSHAFPAEGMYFVELGIDRIGVSLSLPLQLVTQPWPDFTEEEVECFGKTQGIPKSFRANVSCQKCATPFVFEETILSDYRFPAGAQPFPEDGKMKCGGCQRNIPLKDLQGQLRFAIKSAVEQAMNR